MNSQVIAVRAAGGIAIMKEALKKSAWLIFFADGLVLFVLGDLRRAVASYLISAAVFGVYRIGVPVWQSTGFMAVIIVHLLGDRFGLYDKLVYFDDALHVVFPFFGALLLYKLWARFVDHRAAQRKLPVFLLTVLLGVSAETCWEVIEFCSDAVLNSSLQSSNGDTMMDIAAAFVGSTLAAAWVAAHSTKD